MISISPRLDDILTTIARHEEVSIQQVIVKVLEEHMQCWKLVHPTTMAEVLDHSLIGNGTHAEIK